ncbi:MAG: type 2 isopentenyl-diphosphate Delta-isomerase [Actinobacteria bacterium]|nr:type 2 isopentenyl-diphosphate Delta-isomerase [Actinomycetota bacterium]
MFDSNIKFLNGKRKKEHLDISLNHDVNYKKISSGFDDYRFIHQAMPEIDLDAIDLSIEILDKKLDLPLMISPMVGGIEETGKINKDLAKAADICGIAMGVGSQRAGIEDPEMEKTYIIRDVAPDILLFSNLGAIQLNYGFGVEECIKSIEMIDSDCLILHLNPMQEAFQVKGNHNFANICSKIENICSSIKKPVIVREVGFGISYDAAKKLIKAGVSGIDVGGAGGTSWIEIEKMRSESGRFSNIAESFSEWGICTAESIKMVKSAIDEVNALRPSDKIYLIASGGIRTGIEAAKAIALGADMAGIALPILKEIKISVEKCVDFIKEIETGLRIAMFGIGASKISELKNTNYLE